MSLCVFEFLVFRRTSGPHVVGAEVVIPVLPTFLCYHFASLCLLAARTSSQGTAASVALLDVLYVLPQIPIA